MSHPYDSLTPEMILDAVEAVGYLPTGGLLALNSYENRVYQIALDDGSFLVAKFYRPNRWSDAAILEEHAFTLELAEREIPVVAPLAGGEGETLHRQGGFRYALFPRRGGRAPELDDAEVRFRIGRLLGRIHAVGAVRTFRERPGLGPELGRSAGTWLLENDWLPPEHRSQYEQLASELLENIEAAFASIPHLRIQRLHGDCHPGNILWTEAGAHFVDLDDSRNGPAIQDLWMLVSGEGTELREQMFDVLAGYEEFHDFDFRELRLIEPLRALRILNYAGWLARRWDDPAFPRAFPWFEAGTYWDEHIMTLREQLRRIEVSSYENDL